MAIDSAEKRKSLAGIITSMPPGVTPNASKDAEWRQEAGWGYPGIAAGGVVEQAASVSSNWLRRPAGRLVR